MSKVMISLPDEFLRDIDGVARAEHRSRSELVREAMRAYVASHASAPTAKLTPEARRAALRILRSRARLRLPRGETAVSIIRKMRERRYGPTWIPSS